MHGMGDVHPTAIRMRLFERLVTFYLEGAQPFLSGNDRFGGDRDGAQNGDARDREVAVCGLSRRLSRSFIRRARRRRHRAISRTVRRRASHAAAAARFPHGAMHQTARAAKEDADALAPHDDLAALVIEPIQGRGGLRRSARRVTSQRCASVRRPGIVMIVDEIFTGFGRTGVWFAVDRERRRSRHSLHRQGDGLRRSDQRGGRPRRDHGCVAALDR